MKEYEKHKEEELADFRKPEPKKEKPKFENFGVAYLSTKPRTPQEKQEWEKWTKSKEYEVFKNKFDSRNLKDKLEMQRQWKEWDKKQEENYKFEAKITGDYPHEYLQNL